MVAWARSCACPAGGLAAAVALWTFLGAGASDADGLSKLSELSGRAALSKASRSLRQAPMQTANQHGSCPTYRYIYSGPTMDSIFDALSQEEYISVTNFLATVGGLGQGAAGQLNTNVSQFESYVYNVFLHPVNKTEALAHLDEGGPAPKRFATAIVVRGAAEPPDVMEYKVGPLPLAPGSYVQPLYRDGQIPYAKRPPNDLPEAAGLGEWANAVMLLLKDLFLDFMDQCGATTDPDCQGNNITAFNVVPGTREDGHTRYALILHYLQAGDSAAYDLHNLPFSYKVNTTLQDYTEWDVFEFEFCGQGFADPYALAEAHANRTLTMCRPAAWLDAGYTAEWAQLKRRGGPERPGLDRPGPRLYEPAGKRFVLLQGDSNTSRVFQWAGWQGHVTTNPWSGLSFHDVRFKGERILYELSLNDQMVAYSGYSSVGQTYYLDAFDQLGASQYSLRPGYDCPETATYMPVTAMGPYGQQISYGQAVCFFEQATSNTAYRHFDYARDGTAQAEGIRHYEFVVRAISTLGNYDYIITVYFQLDGSVRCQVQMAGYMQTIYYDSDLDFSERELRFGTRVHTNTVGNLHDHLSSWKVDLDVGGTNNSFRVTKIKTGTYDDIFGPGSTPPWARPGDVMKYEQDTLVEREAGWRLSYEVPATFRFVNPASKNAWGVQRGYGIFHGYTTAQLLPSSHPLTKAAAWSKYHIAVTRRKDEEPTSSKDYYDSHSPGHPVWSLDMALNNESIVGQDLVAWVSMGIQHAPRSEDVPVISNVGVEFSIKPVNYFDGLASLDVGDSDNFEACAAAQGRGAFDYGYSAASGSGAGAKGGFKVTGPLNSRDVFQRTGAGEDLLAPMPSEAAAATPGVAQPPPVLDPPPPPVLNPPPPPTYSQPPPPPPPAPSLLPPPPPPAASLQPPPPHFMSQQQQHPPPPPHTMPSPPRSRTTSRTYAVPHTPPPPHRAPPPPAHAATPGVSGRPPGSPGVEVAGRRRL